MQDLGNIQGGTVLIVDTRNPVLVIRYKLNFLPVADCGSFIVGPVASQALIVRCALPTGNPSGAVNEPKWAVLCGLEPYLCEKARIGARFTIPRGSVVCKGITVGISTIYSD
jgi:hypothetical protein